MRYSGRAAGCPTNRCLRSNIYLKSKVEHHEALEMRRFPAYAVISGLNGGGGDGGPRPRGRGALPMTQAALTTLMIRRKRREQ